MAAGIRVFNDSNTIVIDSDSTNFVFHSKGTLSTRTPPADRQIMPFGSGTDLLRYEAYYCTSMCNINLFGAPTGGVFAIQCASNIAPSQFSYPITSSNGAFMELACEGAVGTTVNWWYFVPVNKLGPSTAGQGLRVFRSNGQIAYDSGYLPIKYVDFKGGAGSPGNNATGGPYTYETGKQYALLLSCGGGYMGGKQRASGIYDYVNIGVGGRVSSNVIYTKDVVGASTGYSLYSGVPYNPLYFSWGIVIVDVTGL